VLIDIISYHYLLGWLFIGLGISGLYLKKINAIYNDAGKAKETFDHYHKLLDKIEHTTFSSQTLKNQQSAIQTENEKASDIFRKFAKILDAFDQRNNMIMALAGNGFLLWDLHYAFKVEKWLSSNGHKVEDWLEVITFFDAQNSLANFAFNHPEYVYPNINKDKNV